MIKFNYNEIEYQFPEKWSEIKLKTFLETLEINEDDLEIDKMIQFISIFTGLNTNQVEDMSVIDFKKLEKILIDLLANEDHKKTPKLVFECSGKKYGLQTQISKMTTAEYLDLDSFISNRKDINFNFPFIMSILYRPIIDYKDDFNYTIEKYNSEYVELRSNLFLENLTMDYVFSAMVFFYLIGQEILSANTPDSSQTETVKTQKELMKMMETMMEEMKISGKDGIGIV